MEVQSRRLRADTRNSYPDRPVPPLLLYPADALCSARWEDICTLQYHAELSPRPLALGAIISHSLQAPVNVRVTEEQTSFAICVPSTALRTSHDIPHQTCAPSPPLAAEPPTTTILRGQSARRKRHSEDKLGVPSASLSLWARVSDSYKTAGTSFTDTWTS